MASYKKFLQVGLALDPIHVGTGGARIGRVDLTIVRDPVTQIPKIPGSSLAGVYRAYVAMAEHENNPSRQVKRGGRSEPWPYYPNCAGLGQPRDNYKGHCTEPDCPVCTVFGFARGKDQEGGFAGLAAFSDAHVLLFPVPTRQGPMWVTSPMALRLIGLEVSGVDESAVYLESATQKPLNLGWLLLPVKKCAKMDEIKGKLQSLMVPDYIRNHGNHLALVPDRLFAHIVNSNLEMRTSVSINPATGAAEEGALFSYEALPRGTVLVWEIIAKNPQHFQVNGQAINAVESPDHVHSKVKQAHPYLEHLGIGGMGTRGMGRVKVLYPGDMSSPSATHCTPPQPSQTQGEAQTEGQP